MTDLTTLAATIDEAFERRADINAKNDLGETAAEVLEAVLSEKTEPEPAQPRPELTLERVNDLFEKLHAARGPLGKTSLLTRALEQCSALEARYLVKIITGDLRIGWSDHQHTPRAGMNSPANPGKWGQCEMAISYRFIL